MPAVVLDRKNKWLGQRQPALTLLDNISEFATLLSTSKLTDLYVDRDEVLSRCSQLSQGTATPILLFERVFGACLLFEDLDQRQLAFETRHPIGLGLHPQTG